MSSYTFNDFRKVLTKAGFKMMRSRKHETWRKILGDGTVLLVRVTHKHGEDIDRGLFKRMLKQAGMTEHGFEQLLEK